MIKIDLINKINKILVKINLIKLTLKITRRLIIEGILYSQYSVLYMVSLRCDTETKSPIAQEGRSVFLAFVGVFELFKRKNKTSKGNGLMM